MPPLVASLDSDHPRTRLAAAEGLTRTATITSVDPDFVEELTTYTHTTRIGAVLALITVARKEPRRHSLPRSLPEHERNVRTTALDLVGTIAEAYPEAVAPATPQILGLLDQDIFQEASEEVQRAIAPIDWIDFDTRPTLSEANADTFSREPFYSGLRTVKQFTPIKLSSILVNPLTVIFIYYPPKKSMYGRQFRHRHLA